MRNYTLPAFLLATFLLASSCEEPIDFEVNEKTRLVVISQFSNDNALEVVVSKTQSVLSTDPAQFVTDATVMVFSGSLLLEVLELVPANDIKHTPPFYRSTSLSPQVGKVYTIKVTAPGFEPVTATNTIPVAVPIESVEFSNTVGDDFKHDALVNFDVTVTFHDPADAANFYHLVFYQELHPFALGPEPGDTIRSDAVRTTPIQAEIQDRNLPVFKYYDGRSFLIEDETFNGRKITLPFKGSYTFSREEYLPGRFFVELRTVSEAYWLYHTTLTRQIESSGHPLSEGVVVYGNIANGEGVFAGYSSSTNSFSLTN